ncbi:MAG: hypothetical protein US58_C0001G0025 [Candidatus Magasanikbacteria bacterium GW2011_GWA2_37_8]|uniref:Uncharacterized protein n=1 Tax=Candidatus Magasanikbacteria bacterium GW2011_GWA2_37_8 TaxID=1619036 RepID=A0A0G0KL90_9BACT|nr:MAG: hypothetical protein US58_C0001G0025 [Candidatus Magasanikbacteria bacterium GW2011_GWA2_37_8]
MKLPQNLSFHPKLAAAFEVIFGAIFIWWLGLIGAWWILFVWAGFRLLFWAVLVRLVSYPTEVNRWHHFVSLFFFGLGALSFILFVEWGWTVWLLRLAFVFGPALSFWLVPVKGNELSFVLKPYRRWQFLSCVFGLAGIWSGVYAVLSLQIFNINRWWWFLSATVLSALLAGWWWKEYGILRDKKFLLWQIVLGIIFLETAWAISLWPLGFFINGLLLSWFWYVLWLLGRFQLSKLGVNWKKQTPFLIINFVLLILFLLLIARWK